MSKLTPPTDNDRLQIFESVQFDPELWALVQRKYNHFEELHHEIADLQNQRGELLTQLSKVNESIATLQQQLVTLSGREAEDKEKEQAEAAAKEDAPQPDWSAAPTSQAPNPFEAKHQDSHPRDDGDDDDDDQETVVGLRPLEFEGVDDEDEPSEEAQTAPEEPKIDITPYEPAVEPQAATEATKPAEPVVEQPVAEQVATAPEPSADAPQEDAQIPAEVNELQKLFDEADDQRRQSDSALKLVQLYDGKAETFFAAMCRSHQQSGLSDDDARKEAVKDVQTMIATAKHNSAPAEPKKADEQSKPNGKNGGGMRRLFSHN